MERAEVALKVIIMTVRKLIQEKGEAAARIHPDTTIVEALEALEAEDVGALIVTRNGKKIFGIISERDIVRGLRKYGRNILDSRVSKLMSKEVITCELSDSISCVLLMMENHNIRHIPVVSCGEIRGIVSMRDITKDRILEMQTEADAVRNYISIGS